MPDNSNVVQLETLTTPEELIAAADQFTKPVEVQQTVDVATVEAIRDEIAEVAKICAEGLFPDAPKDLHGVVWTPEQLEESEELIARLKERTKSAEKTRKTETDPLEQAKKAIIARWRALTKYHTAALDKVTQQWQAARAAIEKREAEARRIAEEKAQKERDKLLDQADQAEGKGRDARADNLRDRAASVQATVPAAFSESKSSAINMRDEWGFELVDASKLPREYLIPDESAILKTVKAMKERAETLLGGAIKVTCRKVPVAKRR